MPFLILAALPALFLAGHYHQRARQTDAYPGHARWSAALSIRVSLAFGYAVLLLLAILTPLAIAKLPPGGYGLWMLGIITAIGAGLFLQWAVCQRLYDVPTRPRRCGI